MSKLEDFTRTADIQADPELFGIFPIAEETLNSIVESMKERGYDKAEPVVVWGRNIVVDGHTRPRAVGEAGIQEISVEEKEFANTEESV